MIRDYIGNYPRKHPFAYVAAKLKLWCVKRCLLEPEDILSNPTTAVVVRCVRTRYLQWNTRAKPKGFGTSDEIINPGIERNVLPDLKLQLSGL